jgi:hypothetical protein
MAVSDPGHALIISVPGTARLALPTGQVAREAQPCLGLLRRRLGLAL